MAPHGWRRTGAWFTLLGAALAAGFVNAAGQAGLAYGLNILRWDQSFDAGRQNAWNSALAWVAWIAAASVPLGALSALRTPRRGGRSHGAASRIGAACAAAAGATVTTALVLLPARTAHPPGAIDPGLTAAVAAVAGVVLGLLVAVFAVMAEPAAGNVVTTVVALWGLALVRVALGAEPGDVRLGVAGAGGSVLGRPWEMPALAALLAGAVAGYARWIGISRIAIVASGAAGPALAAGAYVIAGPGSNAAVHDQSYPYQSALVAVAVGLAVSLVVALARRPRRQPGPQVPERDAPSGDTTVDLTPAAGAPAGAGAEDPDATTAARPAVPAPRPDPGPGYDGGHMDWVRGLRDGEPGGRHGTVYGR